MESEFSYNDSKNIRLCRIWLFMHQRCCLPTHGSYSKYGGAGITICKKWLDNFEAFRKWALSSGYENHLTCDRIDNNKGYSPNNCRWVTTKEQARNKRNNVFITAFGETKCAADWTIDARTRVSHQQLIKRIRSGMPPEKAITTIALQDKYYRSETERECTVCRKIKSRLDFHFNNSGHRIEPNQTWCKECQAEYTHNRKGHKTRYQKLYKGETERECGACRQIKPYSEFYLIRKSQPGKYMSSCKPCMNEHSKSWGKQNWQKKKLARQK
jgi:hypothetical protein